jgi:imidazolonepropionase-like amidohydrolase
MRGSKMERAVIKISKTAAIGTLISILLGMTFPLSAQDVSVIEAKKIYTAAGEVIENGIVLIKNGKILRVGRDFAIPDDAKVIKAQIVIPGMIDIHSHLGVYGVPAVKSNEDGNEMTNPITPEVRALDSFNFEDPALSNALAGGVTTIVSRPGSGNVIGGTSMAVKLKKAPAREMILKEICDLKMTIEGNPVNYHGRYGRMPTSMMGVYFLARKAFIEAQYYMRKWDQFNEKERNKEEAVQPERDIGKDALVMALKREIPVHIHVNTASEIMSCIRLADEFNLRLTLAHCQWAYLITDELAKRKDVHFNIGPAMFFSHYENAYQFKNCPAILANAGANVSLQIDAVSGRQPSQRHFLHTAAVCVRYGMKEEDALKAITIRAAEGAGLEDRIGSIRQGKDADLVFLNGEPFEWLTSVTAVMIDGKMEYTNSAEQQAFSVSGPHQSNGLISMPHNLSSTSHFAIRGGTVFTMAGSPIKEGIILVKNGKIERIGKNIAIPEGCPVVDAREKVIMPGLISARSQIGIASNWDFNFSSDELSSPVTPELEVKHALEPQDPLFSAAQKLGVTALMITPGDRNVIGGQGIVIKTRGSVVDKMIVKDNAVMLFGLGSAAKRENRMPSTRMGMAAMIRKNLFQAKSYSEKMEASPTGAKVRSHSRNFSLEALVPVIKGEMPAMFHCERKDDILTALRIADEFNLKTILTGGAEAHMVADEIKKRKIPVVLETVFRGGGNIEDRNFNLRNVAILSRAGVKVNFTLGDYLIWYIPMGLMGADPLEIAAFSYKYGMDEEAALRSITIDAARMIGCEDRIGSLEPGKDADILILKGHPFKIFSVPLTVFIDGQLVYQRQLNENL